MTTINTTEYKNINRLIVYYEKLSEILNNRPIVAIKKREIIGIAKEKLFYPNEFDEMNAEIMDDFSGNEDPLL